MSTNGILFGGNLGTANFITASGATTGIPVIIGENYVSYSGTGTAGDVLIIASGLCLQGQNFNVSDFAGNAANSNIVVSGNAGVTVNGALKVTLTTAYQSTKFVSSGTNNWVALGK